MGMISGSRHPISSLIGNMPHFSYIVSAVGITLARMIRAPYQIVLVAGRLANVILYAVVSFIAIRTSPRLKENGDGSYISAVDALADEFPVL